MNWELFRTFFHIGLFTIGGGYAMIPLIEAKVVDEKHWLQHEELLDLIAVAQSSPGIFAINISIFIGYKLGGVRGATFSTIATALPSFLIILAIALCFTRFRDNIYVERVFRGIRPAVVALILAPVFRMARMAKINRYNVWIPIVATLLIWALGFSPIYVILLACIGGYVYGQIKDDKL